MTTGPLPPQPHADSRGLKGLPPFVDVVYGAVLGFGVFKIEEAIRTTEIPARGNQTALFLLVVTSFYLVFDYAQTRMCIERYPYRTLTRYSLDVFSAIAFVFAFVAANRASPYYFLWLSILLFLSACWIVSLDREYPELRLRSEFLTYVHVAAVVVLVLLLFSVASGVRGVGRWIIPGSGFLFLLYSFGLSLFTHFTNLSELERGLLPIIPFYALLDLLRRAFHSAFQAFKAAFHLEGPRSE